MTMQFLDDFFNPTPTEDEQKFLCTLFTLTDNDKQEAFAQLYVNDTATFIRLFSNLQENPEQQALFTSLSITDVQRFLAILSVLNIDDPLRSNIVAVITQNFGQIDRIAETIQSNQDFFKVLLSLNEYPFKQRAVAKIFTALIQTQEQFESLFKDLKAIIDSNPSNKHFAQIAKQISEHLAQITKLIFYSLGVNRLKNFIPDGQELTLFLKRFNAKQSSIIFDELPSLYLNLAFFGTESPTEVASPHGVDLTEQVLPRPL
ncbi:MAG TPA: hypothetical protein DIC51_01995 [Coxiellaceae bacterium]|nr:hypothetical protein [Coxiellaceae bacterium]